ncbi:MAG: type II secretion system F family protein [Bdellovibrio sp. CG10_big_fil_rev_8_21_14_0_10_47_8]|nr:MAG: type II secretion system F family protein [Bdellovibrio sp. CG10_big_fil_rev_8_21_14_0_10_47_8]
MARYLFQAKNLSGQVQMGQIEANDESDARQKLRGQNLTPLKLIMAPGSKKSASFDFKAAFERKVPSKDLQIFTRQFSTLINSGIPVVDSLKMLSEGKRNPMLKEAAVKVRQLIESGKRLGDAMAANPLVFDRFYVNMVRAGEEAGILDGILLRLATYMEKSEKIKKQVKGALILPGAIIFVAIIVVTGILVFVIPRFQDLYKGAGKELPALTQLVVNLSQFLIHKWYVALGLLILIPWSFLAWYKTEEGKETCDRIFIQLPLFGDLIQKSSVARLTRTLSTLLSSGVGVIEALEIASKTAGNKVIEDALMRSKDSVISGKPLATPLIREKMIPDMVTQMIAIGEQSGTLDTMLGKIADFYEDDVENAVKALTSMIEPLLMIFLGGVIAVLVLAMYMPIFDMANVVTGGK